MKSGKRRLAQTTIVSRRTLVATALAWQLAVGDGGILAPVRAKGADPAAAAPRATPLAIRPVDASGLASAPLPAAIPNPPPAPNPSAAPISAPEPAAPAAPTGTGLDLGILPGRTIEPIDLANALRLAGARHLDIAIARQVVNQSLADLSGARALWLPSLFLGPTWFRADGQIQTVTGQVQTISRNALFLGGVAATANPISAPSPGTGMPQTNGSSMVLRISDAIYLPMAARRVAQANVAGVRTATNDALLNVSEAYFDLQLAAGRLAIAREAAANAQSLADITNAYEKSGQGKPADNRRALTELRHQRRLVEQSIGQFQIASANLVRLLVLDQRTILAPVEPAEAQLTLFPDDCPIDALLIQGYQNRPELAQNRELLEAAIIRVRQAKMRPFIPSVGLNYSGGGFGGGQNAFFGAFGPRSEFGASMFWELQSLGFTDLAIYRRRRAEREQANLTLIQVETQVAADVSAAYALLQASIRQVAESRETVLEAVDSLKLNFIDMREGAMLPRATRPIEVLQPIQALAQGRTDYLESVLSYNRAQFRLKRAVGQTP